VIDLIETQHRQVQQLFTAVASGDGQPREDAFCELRRMLAIHETAEEEVVYPALRSAGEDGRRIADARTAEEAQATKQLAALEQLDPAGSEFETAFETFRKAVLAHAEAEERDVLPLLRSSQDAQMLARMASAFELAEKAAPTHPHPHAGTSAVSNLVAGPALAIIDHVRDALKQR